MVYHLRLIKPRKGKLMPAYAAVVYQKANGPYYFKILPMGIFGREQPLFIELFAAKTKEEAKQKALDWARGEGITLIEDD